MSRCECDEGSLFSVSDHDVRQELEALRTTAAMPRFGQPPNLDRGKLNHTNDGAIAHWSSIIPELLDPGHNRVVGLSFDSMLSRTQQPDTNCTHAARRRVGN